MYKLENHKINNAEPWSIPIEKRMVVLTKNSSRGKIVYIYEKADTSTFRYRVYNMCQSLSYGAKYIGTYFFEEELAIVEEYLDKIALVVIVRTRWSLKLDNFISRVRKENIRILFDVDDIVIDLESLPLLMSTSNVNFNIPQNYDYWFSYVGRLWLTGNLCDGFISTNKILAENISRVYNKSSFIINNFLNDEQIELSEKIFREKIKSKSENPFVIGYFSGSPSHTNDFKKAAPEIEELMKKYKNINLEIVGFMDIPVYLSRFLSEGRVIHSNFVDFLTLQKKIGEVDVNIVPLINNNFTNCKSELKFFEPAIVGTITCATPTYVYKNNIQNGRTGFLCEEGEWHSTIEKIYKNDFNKEMILHAREYCLENYSPKAQTKKIEDILDSL